MELQIDQEFKDLIPPLAKEEYESLEKNIVENGFNPAFPVILWKDKNIVVDGHNRLGICTRLGIPYTIIEQEFETRYDVVTWILDNQLARRNVGKLTKIYLIGRRYLVEKLAEGDNQYTNDSLKRVSQNGTATIRTDQKIGDQLGIGRNTVNRAAEFTSAVDTIVKNTGIKVNDILSGKVKPIIKDIVKFATESPEMQVRVISRVTEKGDLDLISTARTIKNEDRDREKGILR